MAASGNQRDDSNFFVPSGAASEDSPLHDSGYRLHVEGFELRPHRRFAIFTMAVEHGGVRWPISRRFRQVSALHRSLLRSLGQSSMGKGLPALPPRVTCLSVCRGQLDDRFLQARVCELQTYFDDLLRYIPNVEQSEALYEFLCCIDVSAMSYDTLLDLEQAVGSVGEKNLPSDSQIAALPAWSSTSPSWRGVFKTDCCVVCQEYMLEHEDTRVLPCGHRYHFQCISRWLQESNSCCVCQSVAVHL
uniref:RING-type E3 ubiquitin transferase n=1 Tax=Noctiluca scintillans TaxID=2966 RepID=A0A7S1AV77_NOCSC